MTDKVSLGYLPSYERIRDELDLTFPELGRGADGGPRILEVGVYLGGGMDLFRRVFETEYVYGVDINSSAGTLEQQARGAIFHSSQDDPGLPLVLAHLGPFHLIADDASHEAGPTSVTLANLWQHVIPGGYYVIEDWNYLEAAGMASNLWQKVFGEMLAYPGVGDRRPGPAPYSGMLPDVEEVTIRDGMIIIRRSL